MSTESRTGARRSGSGFKERGREPMKTAGVVIVFLATALAPGLFTCTTEAPVDSGQDRLKITLSVHHAGVREAEFTGTPINAIVELTDSTLYEEIDWYCGAAKRVRPAVSQFDKIVYIEVPLYWSKDLPTPRDTAFSDDGRVERLIPYDMIFVKVGSVVSNAVVVKVINRAPIIDSIDVGDTSIAVEARIYSDNIFTCSIDSGDVDSSGLLTMELHVHEYDSDFLRATWRPTRDTGRILIPGSPDQTLLAVYNTKSPTRFRDTVNITVSDGRLGDVDMSIVLVKVTGSDPIRVDSLRFRDTVFADTGKSVFTYECVTIDTALVRLYTNAAGVSASWEAATGVVVDTSGSGAARGVLALYECRSRTCDDTVKSDTKVYLDSVSVTLTNRYGDVTTKSVRIVRKPANARPVIDNVVIGAELYTARRISYLMDIAPGDTIEMEVGYHDVDNARTSLAVVWEGYRGGTLTRDSEAPKLAEYVAKQFNYCDTLDVIVRDSLGFADTATIALAVFENTPPVIDSITVLDLALDGARDSILAVSLVAGQTVDFNLYAHEIDTAWGDSIVAVSWDFSTLGPPFQYPTDSTVLVYPSMNSSYGDTITVTVTDTYDGVDRKTIEVTVTDTSAAE